jgi:hypothetical protein
MTERQMPCGAGVASRARQKVRFPSAGTERAAWFYPGTNGGCVIMTGGFAVTKEPGTDLFADRFNEAGCRARVRLALLRRERRAPARRCAQGSTGPAGPRPG